MFEERDNTITYKNSNDDIITHYNTTYYAIFVDDEEKVAVNYESKQNADSQVVTGIINQGIIYTNVDEYYLVLKYNGTTDEQKADFIKSYEINEVWSAGVLKEVYSYLRLSVNTEFVNINDYIIHMGNEYYFRIPVSKENKTEYIFYDRAGNETKVIVSMTQIAPSIQVQYNGQGKDLTATLTIRDTQLANALKGEINVEFSTDGTSYSTSANILASLICLPNTQGSEQYGCSNIAGLGTNRYTVNISNKENLYGFFRVTLKDNHGNTNSLEFVYNPMDLEASFETVDVKYITPGIDIDNVRMISKDKLQIKWDNNWNYIIVYKVDGENRERVCQTKSDLLEARCSQIATVEQIEQYSILSYSEEGLYEVEIYNRASEIINNRCYEDGELKPECSEIKPTTTNDCNASNPDYCVNRYEVMHSIVSKEYSSIMYTLFEVDKTIPQYDINDFVVELPTGQTNFEDNQQYTNAKVTIKWSEPLVRIHYSCKYVQNNGENECVGNFGAFSLNNQEYVFEVTNKISTEYTFWFEDFAGNTTENTPLTFTINVVLPDIEVYQTDGNGQIYPTRIVENNAKINTNAKLKCYSDATEVDCNATYDVKLYRAVTNGYELVTTKNNTFVSENFQNTYRYVVSIKASNGYVYENLSSEIIFTIDKVAPSIFVEGEKHEKWGIYKGSVRVLIDADGTGTIYTSCVETGIDEYGDKTYDCDQILVDEFKHNYTLDQTGIYKIIAVDEIGNITTGRLVKYVIIDNDEPTISIEAKNEYVEYQLAENGYTNAESITITSDDNNPNSYVMYRIKKGNGEYGEWITHSTNELVVSEEGMYEVKSVDLVGNESYTRHFIIYRQLPKYSVFVGNSVSADTSNQIITENVRISWSEPEYETEAPIIKVTMNGRPYERQSIVSETGEYVFVFVDLAGNTTTHKLTINKEPNICLDNIKILPNKQYLFHIDNMKLSGGEGYTFKENDVIIFATPTNYYGGTSACGENILCYKTLSREAYIVLSNSTANYINKNKNVGINLEDNIANKVRELGGFVYAFVVDLDVATNDLGFEIGESFFTEDPLGWTLIFAAGVGLIYVGMKLFVFRKKVKVLK